MPQSVDGLGGAYSLDIFTLNPHVQFSGRLLNDPLMIALGLHAKCLDAATVLAVEACQSLAQVFWVYRESFPFFDSVVTSKRDQHDERECPYRRPKRGAFARCQTDGPAISMNRALPMNGAVRCAMPKAVSAMSQGSSNTEL